MKYRLIASALIIAILGVAAALSPEQGGTSNPSAASTSQPSAPSQSSDDAAFKGVKLNN